MSEEELTTTMNSENGVDEAPGDITGWESVAALQNKMGELSGENDQARKELVEKLEYFENLSLSDIDDEGWEEWEELLRKVNAGEYWSDKEIVDRMAKLGECKVYELCEAGMPVEIVLDDPEYYNEMVEDQQYRVSLSVIGMFYESMVGNPEGEKKFREDLIDGKDFTNSLYHSPNILEGQCDEGELNVLKALKRAGVSIADVAAKSELNRNRESGGRFVNFLLDNQILDSEDIRQVYESALDSPTKFRMGEIDAMLQAGVVMPEKDEGDDDAKYWYDISQRTGENELANFEDLKWQALGHHYHDTDYKDKAEILQEKFDFSNASVMRMFAKSLYEYSPEKSIELFRSEVFLEALKTPEFQAAIMDNMEKGLERSLYVSKHDKLPMMFLMLAQNREILEDMQAREVFQNYPNCQKFNVIAKLANGEFTEEDRLSLFVHFFHEKEKTKYFDKNGNPRQRLFNELYNYISDESYDMYPRVSLECFLDEEEKRKIYDLQEISAIIDPTIRLNELPESVVDKYFTPSGTPKPELWRKCFECQKFDYLAKNIRNIPEADFGGAARVFIDAYSKYCLAGLEKISKEEFYEYCTDSGARRELWQAILDSGDYAFFSRMDEEMIKSIDLGDVETQFVMGISRNKIPKSDKIDEKNIIAILTRFIKMDANDWGDTLEDDLWIKEAFAGSDVKNVALGQLRGIYDEYINGEEGAEVGVGLRALYRYMAENGGAGPLTQIEALLGFIGNIESAGEDGRIFTRAIEQKMAKNHWTNQEKTNFYAISTEILQASPELYLEFANLFANIPDKKDFQTFVTEIYPLYRAKLALLRNYEDHSDGVGVGYSTISYESVDMETLKNQLHNALLPFNLQELSADKRREGIDIVRKTIFGEISELFQEKFGFLSGTVPAELSRDNARVIEDMALYLGNLNDASEARKDLIGYYLALQLSESRMWDRMRSGEEVAPGDYLNVASAFHVQEALDGSRANNPVNAENTGIQSADRLEEFRRALQGEVVERRFGSVQTIDLKLQGIFGSVQELMDPDLYPDKMDKARVELLGRYSVKDVGKVAAILYQRLNGKEVVYGQGEEEIADVLIRILSDNDIEVTAKNINVYFQKGLNGIKEPFNIMAGMERDEVPRKINELQSMLMPPSEIVQIFGRLGEEFRPQSGVLAISADLDFLDNLVVKQKDKLNDEEKAAIDEYIGAIRSRMAELDNIYNKIVQNFVKMEKSMHSSAPSGVVDKIREMEKIIYGSERGAMISSTCTTSMPVIIENMRACLSCKTRGINNDTNLTFGEGYKFYLYSNNDISRNDSITDEIVYFVPTFVQTGEDDHRRMSFVMDRVYGTGNSDIMMNHVETVLKKARELKRQFPEVPISIVIPSTSLNSCGVSMDAEGLSERLATTEAIDIANIQEMRVVVPESGFGDHYIEFGDGGARDAGERTITGGVEIIL